MKFDYKKMLRRLVESGGWKSKDPIIILLEDTEPKIAMKTPLCEKHKTPMMYTTGLGTALGSGFSWSCKSCTQDWYIQCCKDRSKELHAEWIKETDFIASCMMKNPTKCAGEIAEAMGRRSEINRQTELNNQIISDYYKEKLSVLDKKLSVFDKRLDDLKIFILSNTEENQ